MGVAVRCLRVSSNCERERHLLYKNYVGIKMNFLKENIIFLNGVLVCIVAAAADAGVTDHIV
jgi:hypothetical protein